MTNITISNDVIKIYQHGLNWEIEQKDDYSGWVVTNNAADFYECSYLEQAIAIVRNNGESY